MSVLVTVGDVHIALGEHPATPPRVLSDIIGCCWTGNWYTATQVAMHANTPREVLGSIVETVNTEGYDQDLADGYKSQGFLNGNHGPLHALIAVIGHQQADGEHSRVRRAAEARLKGVLSVMPERERERLAGDTVPLFYWHGAARPDADTIRDLWAEAPTGAT